jgi:pyruvate formate lyase activating enzyme
MYNKNNCLKCLSCLNVCPNNAIEYKNKELHFNNDKCKACGLCVNVCLNDAIRITGKSMTADEVLSIAMRDQAFYKTSGGGITVSGGEPTFQLDFLEELLLKAKKNGINTAIETCGYAKWESFERIIPLVDVFLYDIKHVDPKKHIEFTGVSCDVIMSNITKISALGKRIFIRIPLIPEFNASEKDIIAIANFIKSIGTIEMVHILPYHRLGVHKYVELDRTYTMEKVEPIEYGRAKQFIKYFSERQIKAKVEV